MLKSLERFVQEQEDEQKQAENPKMQELINKCRGLPFYIWGVNKERRHKINTQFVSLQPHKHNDYKPSCCFNHVIGLPTKNGEVKPLFDYEHMIYRTLTIPNYLNYKPVHMISGNSYAEERERQKKMQDGTAAVHSTSKLKHLAVLKASGLGITEFMLRFMAWLCLHSDDLKGSQMIIFTGPRLELAVSLIQRLKDLFKPLGITFTDKETVLNLNGVRIEAFPSHHAATARGLPNVSLIFVDEASFIPDREANEVYDIMMRYVPKSDPYIICVSTPNKPNDMMFNIMNESFESSPFKRLWLDYSYGINKIYTQEEIDKIKNSRSFAREYCLQFVGVEGNVFSQLSIDRCISTGESLAKTAPLDDWSIATQYVMSLDPGWGSSSFAIMISRFVNGKVQILYSNEFPRANFQNIIDEIWRLKNKCNSLQNILLDASATGVYTALCQEFNQNPSLEYLREKQLFAKKVNRPLEEYLFVTPVPFQKQGREILSHTRRLIEETEEDNGTALVSIHPSLTNLINSMRSAYATEDLLDKERTVNSDTFDALRMNLSYYRFDK